jgi:hypothetical protein
MYSPAEEHVVYYHPGDYGLADPGVTTDYNGIVKSLHRNVRADPENKQVPFLVDWARRHGELPDLHAAAHDPANEEHLMVAQEFPPMPRQTRSIRIGCPRILRLNGPRWILPLPVYDARLRGRTALQQL